LPLLANRFNCAVAGVISTFGKRSDYALERNPNGRERENHGTEFSEKKRKWMKIH
jgi:hypothetical protein